MADIELVIKIPEELKNKIDNANEDNYRTYMWWFDTTLYCAIKNGTTLTNKDKIIEKLKEKSYLESEYGVDEFDASRVIQLSDAIEIIDKYKVKIEE